MKKAVLVLMVCTAVALMVTDVQAQGRRGSRAAAFSPSGQGGSLQSRVGHDSSIFFDVRPTAAEITTPVDEFLNGNVTGEPVVAGRGGGQVLRVSPVCTYVHPSDPGIGGPYHDGNATAEGASTIFYPDRDGDNDVSTAKLYLYMDVDTKCSTSTPPGDVIAAIGLDMDFGTTGGGAATNSIDFGWVGHGFTWSGLWDDVTNEGKVDGSQVGTVWTGAKAVKVPVNAVPEYDASGGLEPSADPYLLGELSIRGAPRTCAPFDLAYVDDSTYELYLHANNLLIVRVCDAEDPGDEMVSFGYDAGVLDPAVSGSVAGNPTLPDAAQHPDAIIVVRLKGDANRDGRVTGGDIGDTTAGYENYYLGSMSPSGTPSWQETQEQLYVNDFNNDLRVTGGDNLGFIAGLNIARGDTCP